jgi:hypothetical protein
MLGFGSPDDLGYDWGFGDVPVENPIVVIDWGFGDVPPEPLEPLEITVDRYPDDGGELVSIAADWPVVGPFHVQLIQSFTDQVYPDVGDAPGTFAPLLLSGDNKVIARGSPYWCYTGIKPKLPGDDPAATLSDGLLTFVLPVVPPGLYDVKVSWGSQIYPPPAESSDPLILAHVFHSDLVIDQAIRVVYRNRSLEQWRMRRRFPEHFTTGARSVRATDLLEGPGD